MTKKQKAVERFLSSGGEVKQCPLGYAVAPVDRVVSNALMGGHIVWYGSMADVGTGCRNTIKQSKGPQ